MPDSITCPRCGRTSYNPNDVKAGYCGWCHWWTSDPLLGSPETMRAVTAQGGILTPLEES